MRRWWLKEEEQEESQFMWIPCAVSTNVQGKENIESHPILPQSLLSSTLFVRFWVCEWGNNAFPQSPSTIVVEGVKRALWKEEGWVVFRPVWPFPSNSVWEDPQGHTDTPFLHPQTLYCTSRTEAMQEGEEGGVKQTEQRNFSDWGGIKIDGERGVL